MYKRILVPLDGSEQAESVLTHAQALAENILAEIFLLRIIADHPAEPLFRHPSQGLDAERADGVHLLTQGYLDHLAEPLRAHHIRVTTEVCRGPAAETILRCAEDWQVDLIALSTHGTGGPTPWLMDNTIQQIVWHARIPVLLVGGGTRTPRGASLSEDARLARP